MDIRLAGFTPGQRRDNPRSQERNQRPEVQKLPTPDRVDVQPQQKVEVEPFNLKADKRYREAKVLLRWLQQYDQDFDRIQQTGKVYDWVQGTGERFALVNDELAEMVEEKMETLGMDDPKMAAKVLQQELYTRGFEQVQSLRRQPGLDVDSKGELDAMYWDFDDRKPGQQRAA